MLKELVLEGVLASVDGFMALIPRKRPAREALSRCRVVSHRGEHDNRRVFENTIEAFKIAVEAGVWGIEADIRWTSDLVPVIIHDPDTKRVFGKQFVIQEMKFSELREFMPEVPTLGELIESFGGETHLMLELKEETFPDPGKQAHTLQQHLSKLEPCRDYHILALNPEIFERFDIKPRKACLPVSLSNASSLSKSTLWKDYGGLTGHYVLLRRSLQERHAAVGQKIGTGFIRSRSCLYREINRDIEWLFTNDAVKLQRMIDTLLA